MRKICKYQNYSYLCNPLQKGSATNGRRFWFGDNIGEMAEWSNAAVLKTVDLNGSGGSNPSLSAEKGVTDICDAFFNFSIPKISQNHGST